MTPLTLYQLLFLGLMTATFVAILVVAVLSIPRIWKAAEQHNAAPALCGLVCVGGSVYLAWGYAFSPSHPIQMYEQIRCVSYCGWEIYRIAMIGVVRFLVVVGTAIGACCAAALVLPQLRARRFTALVEPGSEDERVHAEWPRRANSSRAVRNPPR